MKSVLNMESSVTNKIKLLADKDCSVGKALKRTCRTPRESNKLGSAFLEVA